MNSVCRADGTKPYNGYLWDSESWWLGHEDRNFHSRWHFGFVALSDGRYSIDGSVFDIEREPVGIVFATRTEAIRAAAARLIREMRGSQTWSSSYGGMQGKKLAEAINWVLATVARETNKQQRRTVTIADPVIPAMSGFEGMELFAAMKAKQIKEVGL